MLKLKNFTTKVSQIHLDSLHAADLRIEILKHK